MALPNYQAAGAAMQSAGGVSPAWPASHNTNDIGFLFAGTANEVAVLTDAQGFAEITGSPVGLGVGGIAGSIRLSVFWCRAGTSNQSAPTFADAGDHISTRMITVRGGVATGYPVHLVTSDTVLIPDSGVTIPGGTTTIADCLILQLVGQSIDSTSNQVSPTTNPDLQGLTDLFETNTNTGVGGGFAFSYGGYPGPGTFSPSTGTMQNLPSTQVRMSIAVLPVSSAGAGTPNIHGIGTLPIAALQDIHLLRVVPLGGV